MQIAISSVIMSHNNQIGCKLKLSGECDMSRIEISNLNSAASFLTELTATDTIQITGGSSCVDYSVSYNDGAEEDFGSYYSYDDSNNGDDDDKLTGIG
jgi:hypothetical protein